VKRDKEKNLSHHSGAFHHSRLGILNLYRSGHDQITLCFSSLTLEIALFSQEEAKQTVRSCTFVDPVRMPRFDEMCEGNEGDVFLVVLRFPDLGMLSSAKSSSMSRTSFIQSRELGCERIVGFSPVATEIPGLGTLGKTERVKYKNLN
jgi:hypothetical protein